MNKLKNQYIQGLTILSVVLIFWMAEGVSAKAAEKSGYTFPNVGIATVLSPSSFGVADDKDGDADSELNITQKFEKEKERMLTEIVMANVNNTLNVRADASEDASKVGYLYRDCGGTILEQKNGWTKIRSGSLTGWCSDEYLLFGDDAVKMAEEVGYWVATTDSEALKFREGPSMDAPVMGLMAKADLVDVDSIVDNEWVSVDIEGEQAYINANYVNISFHIDEGESVEQVKAREKIEEAMRKEAEELAAKEAAAKAAEAKAAEEGKKENKNDDKKTSSNNNSKTQSLGDLTGNRGAVSADADELRLLAALIYCEAGNQSYEGKVAVGAVVMNRVKSPAYPNTIYSVIYASGQFTPARSGKVAAVYEKGAPESCVQAAIAALNGETTVGSATHFRRADGRAGYVLGAHVFW